MPEEYESIHLCSPHRCPSYLQLSRNYSFSYFMCLYRDEHSRFLLQPSTTMTPVASRSCVCKWATPCTYWRNWKVSEASALHRNGNQRTAAAAPSSLTASLFIYMSSGWYRGYTLRKKSQKVRLVPRPSAGM